MVVKARKPNYKTSPMFALTYKQKQALIDLLRPSIEALKKNVFHGTDWYNIGFRLKAGVEIAKVVYVESTVKDMEECLKNCMSIKDRFIETKHWTVTDEELQSILTGMEAVEEMQNQVTRRQMMDAHLIAEVFMKQHKA